MRVVLKLATSLDGRIATASGESRWISGPAARERVHRMRAEHACVLVGVETVIADDPELSVRLEGYEGRQPIRVVLDSRQRLPLTSKLATTAHSVPTWVVTTELSNKRLTDAGVIVIEVDARDGRVNLETAVQALKDRGVASIMVEGGGQVAASFIAAGLVDEIDWVRAPIVLGAQGRPAIGDLALGALADAPRYRLVSTRQVGDDLWEHYGRL